MKGLISIFYIFVVTAVFAQYLSGVNKLMDDLDVRYFWVAVSAGVIIFLVASLIALEKGFKIKKRFNPVIIFANAFFSALGFPIVMIVFVEHEFIAAAPPILLQVGFPLMSFVMLLVSCAAMFEKKEAGPQ